MASKTTKKTATKAVKRSTAAPKKAAARKPKAPVPTTQKARTSAKSAQAAANADSSLKSLRVRMYRVGFGDFFLVSVPTKTGAKHILIDCGVHAKDTHSIAAAVDHMAKETDHQLALIIVTHRHADHVTGFSKCKDTFKQFKVERIWMSWYEDPKDDQAMALQANISSIAFQLRQSLAARRDPASEQYRNMVENITDAMAAQGGQQNPGAFEVLRGFSGNPPIDYYKAGDKPVLPSELAAAGLQVQILGPPIDKTMVSKTSKKSEEYLASDSPDSSGRIEPFANAFHVRPSRYKNTGFRVVPRKLLEQRVGTVQPDVLAAKAAMANNLINNQSLVTLFTFKGKTLLFAGDAQWGNWANFLYGGSDGTTLAPSSKAILGKLDFYKVGHHGSTNATPKDALAAMREGCVAMCSTEPGAYNEVPRGPLVAALKSKTNNQFVRSDQVGAGTEKTVAASAGKSIPSVFKANTIGDCGYIDYVV